MPPLLAGIEDKKWKVKAGCIQAPRWDPAGFWWRHLGTSGLPSGKQPHNHGKIHHFEWENQHKSTISMAIFNSFLYVYQRAFHVFSIIFLGFRTGSSNFAGPVAGFEADGGNHHTAVGQLPSCHCLQIGRGTMGWCWMTW